MEQYLNLVWKNYTASLSQKSDDDDFMGDHDDASDTFAGNDLHYKIPFWIGVIVISLLCLSAIIASIRYCFYTLCSSHTETEKVALVPPKSPCATSSTANTIQRQRHPLPHTLPRHSSRADEISLSSPKKCRDHGSTVSTAPIGRQHVRPNCTPSHTLKRYHQTDMDTDEINQASRCRAPVDFRKRVHGIYILPVSPALSSSSSTTTNTDETSRAGCSTMPIRSLRHLSSSTANFHKQSSYRGVKNDSFADSPQPKGRTLPRSHAGTLRRVQPPSQPPPLPPNVSQHHLNSVQSFTDGSPCSHHSTSMDLYPDSIALRFNIQKIYGTANEKDTKRPPPPPVPCRTQKPTVIPIGFEGLADMGESSPQDEYSEHLWPKPPESMSTSEISGPPQILPPSIPYDRLHHDHLIPTGLTRHNSSTNFFQHHRFEGHTMLTESDT